MENFTPISAMIGGLCIGISAVWLMASVGRIAGISGIIGGEITAPKGDRLWRFAFVLGLFLGPLVVGLFRPELLHAEFPRTGVFLGVGGLMVGFGTQMGSGCTSGHGVCGMARLSMRSVIATLTFMIAGVLTVFAVRVMTGG